MSTDGIFPRDQNFVPITENGAIVSKVATLTASNTTASVPLFKVTGSVQVLALYGIVTTALSSNVTATHWRTDDQTAQVAISAAAGPTISSFSVGSQLTRRSLVSTALIGTSAAAAAVIDPVAATAPGFFMPFVVVQKTNGVLTTIDFRYTTTNTPASGEITFYAGWVPLTPGSNLETV
jgi:hypothetical protein